MSEVQSREQAEGRPLTAKGAERREALLAAGGSLFLESGADGFTHRAVARRAGVPLSATTYYFDSLEDLLVESVVGLCAAWAATLAGAVDAVPGRLSRTALARTLVDLTLLGPGSVVADGAGEAAAVAFYQRCTEAGRHPGLRRSTRRLNEVFEGVVAELAGRTDLAGVVCPRLLLAVLDGAMIRALSEGEDPRVVAVADVRSFLGGD